MSTDTKQTNLPLVREFSAGGCVYKIIHPQNIVWLLGKHSGYHKWVLPKGLIEPGEKGVDTAVRETKEEMGVTTRVVGTKPIHTEKYWFVAEMKSNQLPNADNIHKPVRRVKKYQEDKDFSQTHGSKVRVFKTVTFYLMEYVSGDPNDHDWEMEDAGWFSLDKALDLMAFDGEKEALSLAAQQVC